RNPRKDTTYVTAGVNGLELLPSSSGGFPTGGSRDIQWGWNPVGGAAAYDDPLTPNYLVATTAVGTVTISTT
ncbi:hypothetical protein EBQ81_02805, partial [bacterium]|nr:hypothetical protein [bacterium]